MIISTTQWGQHKCMHVGLLTEIDREVSAATIKLRTRLTLIVALQKSPTRQPEEVTGTTATRKVPNILDITQNGQLPQASRMSGGREHRNNSAGYSKQ